jgi:hypothetical protein
MPSGYPASGQRPPSTCSRNHDLVVKLAADGLTPGAICEIVGTNGSSVRRYLDRNSIPYQLRPAAARNHHNLLVQLAEQGCNLTEMATRIGTTPVRVKEYLIANGIYYKPWDRTGSTNPAWKGGRNLDKSGYVMLFRPDHPFANSKGYVREHRLVMEEQIGRYLTPTEVVHHRDDSREARQNNDPSNLKLYDTNADHLRETLAGKCPNWSHDGKLRILKASQKNGDKLRGKTPNWSPEAKARILQAARGPKKRKPASIHPLLEANGLL